MTDTEELMLVVERVGKNWEIQVSGPGLTVLMSATKETYPTAKHAAWMVRQAMDGFLLSSKDGEHVYPSEIRERRQVAFTRAPRGRRR